MERRVGVNKEDNLTVRTNAGSSAGKLLGSVLTCRELLSTDIRGRLQYTVL